MEYAMLDVLIELCKKNNILKIIGYYYPTAKNAMVKKFYSTLGFEIISKDDHENSIWTYDVAQHTIKNNNIVIK